MTRHTSANPVVQARDLWAVVLHHKWIVMFLCIFFCSAGWVTIALIPNYYAASITVLVDPQKMSERYVADSVTMDQLRFDTMSQQIMSATRLERIMSDLNLYPELREKMTHEELIDYMRKNVTLQEHAGGDRNPSLFTITFRATDPKLAAQVATSLAESFIDWDLHARERQATETSKFLDTQLDAARQELNQKDGRLNEFKLQHIGQLPDTTGALGGVVQLQTKLQTNSEALNRLEAERYVLAHSDTAVVSSDPRGERHRLVQEASKLVDTLTALRSRYSDEYPEVQRTQMALNELRQKLQAMPVEAADAVPSSAADARLEVLKREIKVRQEEQQQLLQQLKQQENNADTAPLLAHQFTTLTRDAETARAHYQSLLEKTYSADIATDLERTRAAERFRVLDPARVPEKPVKPNRTRLRMMLVPASLLLGAGCVVLFQKIRGTLSTERLLRLSLPDSVYVIGRIPAIPTAARASVQWRIRAAAIGGSLLMIAATVAFLLGHPHN